MGYTELDSVFERFRYPAGESHLRLRSDPGHGDHNGLEVIEADVRSFDDIGVILTADDVLRRHRVTVEWFVPYFPFARHDRRNDAGDGFELGVALRLVAGLDLTIADPHSDVAGQLRHIPQSSVVDVYRAHGVFDHDPLVVIPDAGATKKVLTWSGTSPTVQATKRRNVTNGALSRFSVESDDLGGRPCVIVDDICDGGGTFIGLADELAAHNAGPLTLAVTHGLFTKGTEKLAERFDRIVSFSFAAQSDSDGAPGVERIPYRTLFEKGSRS